jgi:hypothetical protein
VILILNAVPAVCVAILPPVVLVTANLLSPAGLTVTAALTSDVNPVAAAVMVALPAVVNVTEKVLVPDTSADAPGIALPLDAVKVTLFVAVVTTFQLASTPFTIALNAVPAVWAVGVPVLPVVEPGAAVSPGNNICSLFSAPALTLKLLLVPVEIFVAVIAWLVACVTVTDWLAKTPLTNADEVAGDMLPVAALVVKATVDVKLVTVLP